MYYQAFEVDHRRCEVCLDCNIGQAATNRPSQAVLFLRFTVHSLYIPHLTRFLQSRKKGQEHFLCRPRGCRVGGGSIRIDTGF